MSSVIAWCPTERRLIPTRCGEQSMLSFLSRPPERRVHVGGVSFHEKGDITVR